MSKNIPIIRTVADLRKKVSSWRAEGFRIGLVPTMGALHKGHLSLIEEISKKTDKIIVSIFVNPTQFGENEDLDKYPRQEKEDCEKLAKTTAGLVFAPSASEMYPDGHCTRVTLDGISEILEGAERPGHFDGVATIVSKLLLQCLPDVAIFGEKDYQQLAVIRQFVHDLNIPTKILGGTLVREEDGLAYSSRNAYLNETDRTIAGQFNKILHRLVLDVQAGKAIRDAENEAKSALLKVGFLAVDYVSVVNSDTLLPLTTNRTGGRVLAVARIGGIRLLDNMAIEAP